LHFVAIFLNHVLTLCKKGRGGRRAKAKNTVGRRGGRAGRQRMKNKKPN